MNHEMRDTQKENLIKDNLRRAFDDKASEELPADLVALLAQLRTQDKLNDKG